VTITAIEQEDGPPMIMRWVTAKKSMAPCDIGNIWLQLTELRGGGVTRH